MEVKSELVVTSEMVDAGTGVLAEADLQTEEPEIVVFRIFHAMYAASQTIMEAHHTSVLIP